MDVGARVAAQQIATDESFDRGVDHLLHRLRVGHTGLNIAAGIATTRLTLTGSAISMAFGALHHHDRPPTMGRKNPKYVC